MFCHGVMLGCVRLGILKTQVACIKTWMKRDFFGMKKEYICMYVHSYE
jgi:hypothetical protein